MEATKFKVKIDCASCATKIDSKLAKKGFYSVTNALLGITRVKINTNQKEEVKKIIENLGYKVE